MTEQRSYRGAGCGRGSGSAGQSAFLVVDIAQAQDGRWLVIECNDGQESGYGSVLPVALWQRIIDLERSGQAVGRVKLSKRRSAGVGVKER